MGVETDSSITGWARINALGKPTSTGLSNLRRNRWRNIHRPTSRACLPRLPLSLSLSIFNSLNDG